MGIKNISDNREQIRVSKDRIFYNINMRDIDYIRAYNSETQIFAKGETFRSDDSLVVVEEILDKCVFFKISRSYVVNIQRIKELDEAGRRIKIYDEFIPVTARKMSALKRLVLNISLTEGRILRISLKKSF